MMHTSESDAHLAARVHACTVPYTRLRPPPPPQQWGRPCRELIHEEKAGSIAYRSTFGTQRVGGFIANAFDLYLKNPANTNVVEWGKRLLALWEVRTFSRISILGLKSHFRVTNL